MWDIQDTLKIYLLTSNTIFNELFLPVVGHSVGSKVVGLLVVITEIVGHSGETNQRTFLRIFKLYNIKPLPVVVVGHGGHSVVVTDAKKNKH